MTLYLRFKKGGELDPFMCQKSKQKSENTNVLTDLHLTATPQLSHHCSLTLQFRVL